MLYNLRPSGLDPKGSDEGAGSPSGVRKLGPLRPLILMIEDDFALRWALADYLEGEGFDVESAADGLEGLRRIEATSQRKPAAILLDVMMPRMGGVEFCARHRQSASAIPVILMTGARIDKRDLGALGLHTAFSKPLNMTKLVATLRELVSTVQH